MKRDELTKRFQFRERFHRRYEQKGGLYILIGMVQNGATLQRIGDYFGITREGIRQTLLNITIPPSTIAKSTSIVSMVIDKNPKLKMKYGNFSFESPTGIGTAGETEFFELMKKNSDNVKYNGIHASYDFDWNGLKVDVKKCTKKFLVNKDYPKNSYYGFNLTKNEMKIIDFVFIITPQGYYLIPISEITNRRSYISKRFDPYRFSIHPFPGSCESEPLMRRLRHMRVSLGWPGECR